MKNFFGIAFTTLSWWVCVLSARYLEDSQQMIALGSFVVLSLVLHGVFYVKRAKQFIQFYLRFLLMGLLFDGFLLWRGHFTFDGPSLGFFPLWLLALWLVFPLNFLHTLKKFVNKPLLAGFFGLIGGPLAYKAGPAFGILFFDNKILIPVAIFWATYMLIACRLKRWLY